MSIQCYLNSDATKVKVERRYFDKTSGKNTVKSIGLFDVSELNRGTIITPAFSHKELSGDECEKVIAFAEEEIQKVKEAFLHNATNQWYGGTPIVSRGDMWNRQFEKLDGYMHGVSKGRFLGVIQGARKCDFFSHDIYNMRSLASRFYERRLTDVAKNIVLAEIEFILTAAEKNKDIRGNNCMHKDHAEQILECSEILSKFLKMCGVKKSDYLPYGVSFRVDEFIESIKNSKNTAAIGTASRINDSYKKQKARYK